MQSFVLILRGIILNKISIEIVLIGGADSSQPQVPTQRFSFAWCWLQEGLNADSQLLYIYLPILQFSYRIVLVCLASVCTNKTTGGQQYGAKEAPKYRKKYNTYSTMNQKKKLRSVPNYFTCSLLPPKPTAQKNQLRIPTLA